MQTMGNNNSWPLFQCIYTEWNFRKRKFSLIFVTIQCEKHIKLSYKSSFAQCKRTLSVKALTQYGTTHLFPVAVHAPVPFLMNLPHSSTFPIVLQLWVHAYHLNKGFYLGSNDGMKRMNQMFQYQFLHQHREDFFSKLLRIVVECYVPLQLSVWVLT